MRAKRVLWWFAPLAVLALAGAGSGGTSGSQAGAGSGGSSGAQAGATAGRQWVTGKIIEAGPSRVAIDTENGRMRQLRIDRRTRITVDGRSASAKELRPGAFVMASFDERAGQDTAVTVRVDEKLRGRASPSAPAQGTGSGSSAPAGSGGASGDQAR